MTFTESDDEVYERLTSGMTAVQIHNELPVPSPKKPARAHQVRIMEVEERDHSKEEEFVSSVSESASKIYFQNLKWTKTFLANGDMFSLFRVFSGLCLARNKIWVYNEALEVKGDPRPLEDVYMEYSG